MTDNKDHKKEHKCACGKDHCEHYDEQHEHGCRCEELENNWKRALADYKNLEKRVAEEREVFLAFANSGLILRILPVLDNLEMMVKHMDDEGLKMTIKDFRRVLGEEGVEEIEAEGKDFDAEKMDALEKVEGEEGKVVEVVQKGYTIKDKVLRPARVKVGSGKEN